MESRAVSPEDMSLCMRPDSELLGMRCASCVGAVACANQEYGLRLRRAERERDAALTALGLANTIIREMTTDEVTGFYTKHGVNTEVRNDPYLGEEILQGNVAIGYIDVRGLHAANETFGRQFGDALLREASRRLGSSGHGVRLSSPIASNLIEDRQGGSGHKFDLAFRGSGADEIAVLLRDVSPDDMPLIAKRVQDRFSPERAVQDAVRRHEAPIVASVAVVHMQDIPTEKRFSSDPLHRFNNLYTAAIDLHEGRKPEQYDEMWRLVEATYSPQDTLPIRPTDNRLIIEHFWRTCCDDFYSDPQGFFPSAPGSTEDSVA